MGPNHRFRGTAIAHEQLREYAYNTDDQKQSSYSYMLRNATRSWRNSKEAINVWSRFGSMIYTVLCHILRVP